MKALVVYDSVFGNTQQIAQAIGNGLGPQAEILRASQVKPDHLGLTLLIVGSPTRGFRPTPLVTKFLNGIPKKGLAGVKVASFDTRLTMSDIEQVPILAFLVRLFGYAAQPISDRLTSKGGQLVVPPEGFFVKGAEGPLTAGELERAAEWAKHITKAITP